jgi:hypothetical protein
MTNAEEVIERAHSIVAALRAKKERRQRGARRSLGGLGPANP